eukprot:snap_masked-scaffold559_size137194-processed-gene-0.8 protein:Tk04618 transcript:snap_masked-scaffold559_size137194-processed-gene-0.8-mRNA-1 annotation:"hypothetical protein DAPPUDRAFT_44815"
MVAHTTVAASGVNDSDDPYPRASLLCRPNSHPFQERVLTLDQPIKVGRSVARARPATNNAIFDCKVLSRNHALIWYENGKFFLQDTKSSNGTFVNNQRLSKGSEESLPREVCSGDILQFGVDVMENSRKVTHGCIIATLKLYLPDGKEAKASPTIMNAEGGAHLPPHDLHQLNQYIQEALTREQLLETKLAVLQRIVSQTGDATQDAWKSLIDEDRLLTRVEILESHLSVYEKSMTEDKAREEAARLIAEKEQYQEVAKKSLKNMMEEKVKATQAMNELQTQLSAVEDELSMFRELYQKTLEDNQHLVTDLTQVRADFEDFKCQSAAPNEAESQGIAEDELGEADQPQSNVDDPPPDSIEASADESTAGIPTFDPNVTIEIRDDPPETGFLPVIESDSPASAHEGIESRLDIASLTSGPVHDPELGASSESPSDTRDMAIQATLIVSSLASSVETVADPSETTSEDADCHSLRMAWQRKDLEVTELKAKLEESFQASFVSDMSGAPTHDDPQFCQLLKYKEKYVELAEEKRQIEESFVMLEKTVETLSLQSQTTSACSVIPLAILFVSFIIAYLPTFAAILGTAENIN